MKKKFVIVSVIALLASASAAMAEGNKFMVFSIKAKTDLVKVKSIVGGYTPQQIAKEIAAHCAGASSAPTPDGAARKKRGRLIQKYQAVCKGGPNPKRLQTSGSMTVEIEQMPDGRTMYEYTYSDVNGALAFKSEIR